MLYSDFYLRYIQAMTEWVERLEKLRSDNHDCDAGGPADKQLSGCTIEQVDALIDEVEELTVLLSGHANSEGASAADLLKEAREKAENYRNLHWQSQLSRFQMHPDDMPKKALPWE